MATSDISQECPPNTIASIDEASLTPAMRQYVEQKKRVGDAVLLFRMGDFYETFWDDAVTCSKVLGIALTSRSKKEDDPIPLAGIPYHALDGYLRKLVSAGYKVAISEQLEDCIFHSTFLAENLRETQVHPMHRPHIEDMALWIESHPF